MMLPLHAVVYDAGEGRCGVVVDRVPTFSGARPRTVEILWEPLAAGKRTLLQVDVFVQVDVFDDEHARYREVTS